MVLPPRRFGRRLLIPMTIASYSNVPGGWWVAERWEGGGVGCGGRRKWRLMDLCDGKCVKWRQAKDRESGLCTPICPAISAVRWSICIVPSTVQSGLCTRVSSYPKPEQKLSGFGYFAIPGTRCLTTSSYLIPKNYVGYLGYRKHPFSLESIPDTRV